VVSASAFRGLGHTCGVCPYSWRPGKSLRPPALQWLYRMAVSRRRRSLIALYVPARRGWQRRGHCPLLCAGLIGWRSLVIQARQKAGLYGFGAAAHIVAQVAQWQGDRCLPSRGRRCGTQAFARRLGCDLGGRIRRDAAAAARCGDHFCDRRRSRALALKAVRKASRRLRRHPHEDIPSSLSLAMGRAAARVGC